jgi:hypothetical protein
MSEDAWPRFGATAGIAAAVLFIIGFIVGPSSAPPGFDDSAKEVQAWIQDNRGGLQATTALGFGVLVAIAVFLGSVYHRLRAAEPLPRMSIAALAGGIALLAAGTVGSAAELAALYHVEKLGPDSVLALWDLSVFGYLFVLAGFSVLAGATAAVGLRGGALPVWHGYFSAVAAVYVLVVGWVGTFTETGVFAAADGALGLISFLVLIAWLLATAIVLLREPSAEAGALSEPGPGAAEPIA